MPLWNSVTSRENASKAVAARRRNRQARLDREALLERLLKAESEKLVQAAENPPIKPDDQDDDFRIRKLERVRTQWAKLDALLAEQLDKAVLDAGTIDRVAAAICRLAELERCLAQRPLPGSRRPSAERPRHDHGFTPPIDG